MGYWQGKTWIPDDAAPVAASISRSSAQTVNNTTITLMQLSTSDFSSGGLIAPTVDVATNYRITVTQAGYYRVTGAAECTTLAASGSAILYVYKNGSPLRSSQISLVAVGVFPLGVSNLLLLASGDYVDLRSYQSSGGAQSFGNAQLDVQLLR